MFVTKFLLKKLTQRKHVPKYTVMSHPYNTMDASIKGNSVNFFKKDGVNLVKKCDKKLG